MGGEEQESRKNKMVLLQSPKSKNQTNILTVAVDNVHDLTR